jgi:(p)ppGpp synthase/HD superfamily hydrolase
METREVLMTEPVEGFETLSTPLQRALQRAIVAHEGQKYGTQPYYVHVLNVWEQVKYHGGNVSQQIIALLHDTVEDSNGRVTLALIRRDFGDRIADAVDALTRRKNETHDDYLARVKSSKDATVVKRADAYMNWTVSVLDKDERRIQKYTKVIRELDGTDPDPFWIR